MIRPLVFSLLSTVAFAQTPIEKVVAPGEPLAPVIEALRGRGQSPARITLKAGHHRLTQPLILTAADSHLIITGEPGAILDGSEIVDGWSPTTIHGKPALWRDYEGTQVRALFADGQLCFRPRYPKNGFLNIEGVPGLKPDAPLSSPSDKFVLKEGDFIAKRNVQDVEVVALQLWIAARFPYKSYDPATRLFTSSLTTPFKLHEGWGEEAKPSRYYIDNVFEALTEPGEFYHDREARKLYYIPRRPNQAMSIGRASQLLLISGTADAPVRDVTIENVTFTGTNWYQPKMPGQEHLATAYQAETHVPGVLEMTFAQDIAVRGCTFSQLPFTAVRINDGSQRVELINNQMHDLGAGAIHVSGSDAKGPENARTHHITIRNNHLHHGGRIFHAAIGVLLRHAGNCVVADNEINHFYYTGVSCGWVWGYGENVSRDNVIESNYIHHLGEKWLSDMAGIYTLGIQPGTILRGNIIHDINAAAYGGWAYYFDEGSSEILMENNIGFRTNHNALHLHYGKENRVKNNILASGGKSVVHVTREEPHTGLILEGNTLITDGKPIFTGSLKTPNNDVPQRVISDRNIIWDRTAPAPPEWDAWVKAGHDGSSIVADPQIPDAAALFEEQSKPATALRLRP